MISEILHPGRKKSVHNNTEHVQNNTSNKETPNLHILQEPNFLPTLPLQLVDLSWGCDRFEGWWDVMQLHVSTGSRGDEREHFVPYQRSSCVHYHSPTHTQLYCIRNTISSRDPGGKYIF